MNPTPPPRQLGKYEIITEIARDSIGVTYRGRDPVLDAPVALRVLAPYLAQDAAFMAQFRQEMRRARGLKHPHILALYDFGTDRDAVFLVTELVEGQALADLLAGGQQMDIERVFAIAEQVADALDYAHGQGAIHQDLKPANILIGPNDQVTVTGFGLARAMQGTPVAASRAYGTVAYWSPEQAEGQPATAASDQYSLAAIVFEMLTGRPPFVGETSLAVLRQIIDKPAPIPSQFRKEIPSKADAVLLGALAKLPEQRYATCLAFRHVLQDTIGKTTEVNDASEEVTKPAVPAVVTATPQLPMLAEFQSLGGPAMTMCFNLMGTHLASGGSASRVDVWMLSTRRRLRSMSTDSPSPVLALAFRDVALSAILQTGAVVEWSQKAESPRLVVGQWAKLMKASWIPFGKLYDAAILLEASDKSLRVHLLHGDLSSKPRTDALLTVSGPANERTLAVAPWSQNPADWRIAQKATVDTSDSGFYALANSNIIEIRGFWYERTTSDNTWYYLKGERRAALDHDSPVCSARFSGSDRLLSGCEDGTIRVWDWRTELEQTILHGHEVSVTELQPVHSSCLVTGDALGILTFWQLGDKPAITHACRHDAGITALAYHEGTGVLASADEKGIIRLWKLP